jgi:hemerythrin-like domain-containing protein
MLIYEALKNDHDKLKPLLKELVASAKADEGTRERIIQEIRDEIIPHSRAEEAVFYNSLREIDGTKELVVHGYAEHMEAETILRSLQAMEVVNADWTKLAKKLKEDLEHHISEEENEIFPAAKQVLAKEEAEMMAVAFEQMKPEVREGSFMQNTLDLIANVMPQRFSEPLRNFIHR